MSLSNLTASLPPFLTRPRSLLATLTATLSTTLLLISAVRDYRAYIALGPGGVPHNLAGWLFVTLAIRPFALPQASATATADYPSEGAHEDILDLPPRKGERATLGGIVPHRQLTQHAPEKMREFIQNLYANAATQNPSILEQKRSLYERHNPALFVSSDLLKNPPSSSDPLPETARVARGEISHPHADLSIHIYLSPADAKIAIDRGWAERHRLSLPRSSWFANRYHVADSYLMIYGPRDEEEMEVLAVFLRNAVRFMTGREDVEAIVWRHRLEA
ncbi:hypothetical protein CCHL11_08706 [Colletotrichum chlorophyti]|uniref:Luciferase domain-containing protein n=1 Tax=Colletotrichum chlorophyti TaxID=708187 RepID=A0A1Q8RHE1_9PEZI|nr:hypothetical protein CCHL11_08706 [Colletotrichum chlorophyti]